MNAHEETILRRNAVQLLQDTNMARGPYTVEALRATVVALLAELETVTTERDQLRSALQDIANGDYEGALLWEHKRAAHALAANYEDDEDDA